MIVIVCLLGEGVLIDYLTPHLKKDYLGIDLSAVAVSSARSKRPHYQFINADADVFAPAIEFGTIVFNEMLYYMNHMQTLHRYARFLSRDGVIIISCWFNDKVDGIMKDIFADALAHFTLLDEIIINGHTKAKNLKNRKLPISFKIGVFRPMNINVESSIKAIGEGISQSTQHS